MEVARDDCVAYGGPVRPYEICKLVSTVHCDLIQCSVFKVSALGFGRKEIKLQNLFCFILFGAL